MSCKCAVPTDQYHGWECTVSGGECMFLFPDSIACARKYGEGPDAKTIEEERAGMKEKNDVVKTKICKECETSFDLTVGELEFYNSMNYPEPERCKPCRRKRKAEKAREAAGK